MACAKVRIRFRKSGDLRLVSHHDLMRCFERMLRRAELPFHCSEGFHPKPRLVFALSLGLGIVGCEEVVEIELDQELPAGEVHDRLAGQAPPGLEILTVSAIPPRLTAQVRRVTYRIAIPEDCAALGAEKTTALLASAEVWVERARQGKRLDIRPYLAGFRWPKGALEMDLWVTPTGTARPDEVLALAGLPDLLASGAVLERIRLEIHDECPGLEYPPLVSAKLTQRTEEPAVATTAADPPRSHRLPEPLVPGPLSFET